jgi:glycosyltransferase involved in cell wall biosynthesis
LKKILIITNRFVIGGPAFHVADLAAGLQSDFDIRIVGGEAARGEQVNLDIFTGLQHEPHIIPSLGQRFSPLRDVYAFFALKKFIKTFKPDIIHTHTSKPGLIGRLAALGAKARVIHTYHGTLFTGYFSSTITSLLIRTERFLARKSDAIISLSNQQAKEISQKLNLQTSAKIKVVLPGIPSERISFEPAARKLFRDKYQISDDCVVLGMVGRLVKIKNVELFLRGIKYLKEQNVKVKAVLVGDGPEKNNLKSYCSTLNLSYSEFSTGRDKIDVLFLSWKKHINQLYPAFDVVCLTSISEGTPYSLMEAQMMECPVIASKVGGVEDIVVENKTALLFSTEQEYFDALQRLACENDVRKSMSEYAGSWSKDRFSSRRMIQETKKIYLNLL